MSAYVNPDFLPNILFTSSCNLYIHLEKLLRFFKASAFNGIFFKFFTILILQYLQGNTCLNELINMIEKIQIKCIYF